MTEKFPGFDTVVGDILRWDGADGQLKGGQSVRVAQKYGRYFIDVEGIEGRELPTHVSVGWYAARPFVLVRRVEIPAK